MVVDAVQLTTAWVTCDLPWTAPWWPGLTSVELSDNAFDFVGGANASVWLAAGPPFVSSVNPPLGSWDGGTVLTLLGGQFADTSLGWMCAFSSPVSATPVFTPATWQSVGELRCESPAALLVLGDAALPSGLVPPGSSAFTVNVSVSPGGQTAYEQPVPALFTFVVEPTVSQLWPEWGGREGGTNITVVGGPFDFAGLARCVFTAAEDAEAAVAMTPASVVDVATLTCLSPPLSAGALRAGLAPYSTRDDVDRLIAGLKELTA